MKNLLLLTFCSLLLASCASSKTFSVPTEITNGGRFVEAEATYFNPILLFPEMKTGDVIDLLKGRCSGGDVVGISFEIKTRFIFGILRTLKASGYCVGDNSFFRSQQSQPPRPSSKKVKYIAPYESPSDKELSAPGDFN